MILIVRKGQEPYRILTPPTLVILIKALNRNIAEKAQLITALQAENQQLVKEVEILEEKLRVAGQPKAGGIAVGRKPDGKILSIPPADSKLCYINLGAADRVSPGLTFTVYPPTGIPKNGKGKGTVVITSVYGTTSVCQITAQRRDDPITVNDLVANLAFDPTRTYIFVVEGEFDLYGTGKPTPEGAAEVKALIKRFGGKVADAIDIETDFVILGNKPTPPPKPGATAPAQAHAAYRSQLEVAGRYGEVRALAESMRKAILNTNDFLAFIGHMPAAAEQ